MEIAGKSEPGNITQKEPELVDRVVKKYRELGFVGCTGCRYCMPCPQGVNIPEIFSLYNEYFVKERGDKVKNKYWEHIAPESQAKESARCGKCEELCPQHLSTREILREAAQIFEQPQRT